MNKIKNVTIVSLSSGMMGEEFARHEVKIGLDRLEKAGLNVKFSQNALHGIEYLNKHPEKRADDLLQAFSDAETDMILCAIGGDDTYRLMPYLFDHGELESAVRGNGDKIFLGFSDTTFNHLMLNKVGVRTFYGQSFISDVCEFENEMLPYTAHYFNELIRTGTISSITPADTWYEERTDFSEKAIGTKRIAHKNGGFELLQGEGHFTGEILGGCIDSLFDIFDNTRYPDTVEMCSKYGIFPDAQAWRGKILLLETSEEQPSPEKYGKMLDKHGQVVYNINDRLYFRGHRA